MASEPPQGDREVLSPELVLVSSPDDARRAREQLPERHVASHVVPAPPVDRPPPPAYPRIVLEDFPPEPRHRWRRRRIAFAAGVLGAVAVGGYVTETRLHSTGGVPSSSRTLGSSTTRALGVQPAPTHGGQTTLPKPTAHQSSTRAQPATPSIRAKAVQKARTAKPKSSSPPSSTRAQPATPSTTPAEKPRTTAPKPRPPQPKGPTGFVPARTWAWSPQQGADAYEVTFFLEDRVVFRARPAEPRLVLPSGFRFQAGRYRWTVVSVPAAAAGNPIVDSRFVLTAATAAAANGS